MFGKFGKKAQTTAEYAILIALVVGAVVTMQTYVKKGLQGRVKDVVDDVSLGGAFDGQTGSANTANIFVTGTYEPDFVTSETNTPSRYSRSTENMARSGEITRSNEIRVEGVVTDQEIGLGGEATTTE